MMIQSAATCLNSAVVVRRSKVEGVDFAVKAAMFGASINKRESAAHRARFLAAGRAASEWIPVEGRVHNMDASVCEWTEDRQYSLSRPHLSSKNTALLLVASNSTGEVH